MDVVNYKQLKILTAYFGYPILLRNGMDAVKSTKNSWMLALVNGMDAASYKLLRKLTAYKGYLIMFGNWMDAVISPNPNGC